MPLKLQTYGAIEILLLLLLLLSHANLQSDRHHHSTNKPTPNFLHARCPSCSSANSVRALKGIVYTYNCVLMHILGVSCIVEPMVNRATPFLFRSRSGCRKDEAWLAPAKSSGLLIFTPISLIRKIEGEQLANPGLPWKMVVNSMCVYVCILHVISITDNSIIDTVGWATGKRFSL